MRRDDDLRAEYLLLQGMYEDFDKRALSLKALAAPLLGAGVVVGLKEGGDAVHAVVIAVALSLWVLEAVWKTFQHALNGRIEVLEAWYRGDGPDAPPAPFQIYTAWAVARPAWYASVAPVAGRMLLPFVALPYVVIVAASTLAMVLR